MNDNLFIGESSTYALEDYIDKGTYGRVCKGRDLKSNKLVAIKVMSHDYKYEADTEAKTLSRLRRLDSNKMNVVLIMDYFVKENYFFIVLEKLDISLWHFMKNRNFVGLCVSEIRVVAQQMFVALDALKSFGLVHCDVKPDNIMLVNHERQPFKVKLIDFGVATSTSNLWRVSAYANLGYIAPEVLLDFPFMEEGVDMWALGCSLAFLYLGDVINPTHCEYEALRGIIKLVGQPSDDVVDGALKMNEFFSKCTHPSCNVWRLKTPSEYSEETGRVVVEETGIYSSLNSLDDLRKMRPELNDPAEREDLTAFINLLKQMLTFDPTIRIKPVEALGHDFITMNHLYNVKSYFASALKKMQLLDAASDEDSNHEEKHSSTLESYLDKLTAASKKDHEVSAGVSSMKKSDRVSGDSSTYIIEDFLHEGVFGKVAICREKESNRCVAMKMVKNMHNHLKFEVERDAKILQILGRLDLDKTKLIKFREHFVHRDHFCLVSEVWDTSLREYMEGRHSKGLHVGEIREIARQMLVTLEALKQSGLVHGSVTPDNIVLVDYLSKPLKVKLVEFGFAKATSTLWKTKLPRNPGYSAPEVLLDVPFIEESVDMWCLGSVLAFLHLGRDLIPTECEYEAMRVIVKLLGQPETELLLFKSASKNLFKLVDLTWRLKTPEEYTQDTGLAIQQCQDIHDTSDSLDKLLMMRTTTQDISELKRMRVFIKFLKKTLMVNPGDRICPVEALRHKFITKDYTFDNSSNSQSMESDSKEEPLSKAISSTVATSDTKKTMPGQSTHDTTVCETEDVPSFLEVPWFSKHFQKTKELFSYLGNIIKMFRKNKIQTL